MFVYFATAMALAASSSSYHMALCSRRPRHVVVACKTLSIKHGYTKWAFAQPLKGRFLCWPFRCLFAAFGPKVGLGRSMLTQGTRAKTESLMKTYDLE